MTIDQALERLRKPLSPGYAKGELLSGESYAFLEPQYLEAIRLVLADRDRLAKMIGRDMVSPCACCGVKLSWQFAGDGTNALEVETGKRHECGVSMEDAPKGTYRYVERRAIKAEADRDALAEALAAAEEIVDYLSSGIGHSSHLNKLVNKFRDAIRLTAEARGGQ